MSFQSEDRHSFLWAYSVLGSTQNTIFVEYKSSFVYGCQHAMFGFEAPYVKGYVL